MRSNDDQKVVSDFEKYMYIVPMRINKMCPELASDEDFLQDCYLDFLEYTLRSEAFNAPRNHSRKATYAHRHITHFINQKIGKCGDNNEIASGLLSINKNFSDIERMVFQNSLRENMDDLLNSLTAREKDVLEAIYFFDLNYRDIEREYGINRSDVCRIENRAIKKCRYPSRAKMIRDYYI